MKRYRFSLIVLLCCTCLACNDFLTEYSHDQAYVQSYSDLDELIIGSGYMKCAGTYDYHVLLNGKGDILPVCSFHGR